MTNINKSLAVFDIDDTIVDGQTQRLFLDYLYKNGTISFFFYVKIVCWFVLYKLGLAKNPKKIMETSFIFLKGTSEYQLSKTTNLFYEEVLKSRIYSQALTEIERHRVLGNDLMLLSNAAHPIVKKISEELNIPQFISTELEVVDGIFTGKIKDGPVYGKNKLDQLKKNLSDKRYEKIYGYADHPSDLEFLNFVDEPFVVNPDKKMTELAKINGWKPLNFRNVSI